MPAMRTVHGVAEPSGARVMPCMVHSSARSAAWSRLDAKKMPMPQTTRSAAATAVMRIRFRLKAPVYTSSMIAELFLACGLTRARNFERELRISLRASATASSVRRRESST